MGVDRYSYVGLGLIGASFLMLLIALPRRGEVVGFLRYRDAAQSLYMMVLILVLCLGIVVTLAHAG
jgi:hypothetical protein